MERRTEILPKRILDLSEELMKDADLKQYNLNEKSLACPGIKTKWVQIFFEEQKYLDKLENAEKKLTDDYVKKFGDVNVPKFKTEREADTNEEIKKVKDAIKIQKEVVRYVDMILHTVINGFGFDIKNSLEAQKLESM